MPVNPNEAPEGFVAVEERSGCNGCALTFGGQLCRWSPCDAPQRADQCYVIFISLSKPATANFPHDDMGTPV